MDYTSDNSHRFLWLVLAMLNFIMSPITITLAPDYMRLIIVINFSFIIIAGTNIGVKNRKNTLISIVLGALSLVALWIEFAINYEFVVVVFRLIINMLFYLFVAYRVFYWIAFHENINRNTFLASIAGFLLIGFIGGLACEMLERAIPETFNFNTTTTSTYSYLYFSFISLTSVGYGDITPMNEQGQALTLLMGLAGQFYMAILVGILVGKYLSKKAELQKDSNDLER